MNFRLRGKLTLLTGAGRGIQKPSSGRLPDQLQEPG
jgi:hypothetical protein